MDQKIAYQEKRISIASSSGVAFNSKYSLNSFLDYEYVTGVTLYEISGSIEDINLSIGDKKEKFIKTLRGDLFETSYVFKEKDSLFIDFFTEAKGNILEIDVTSAGTTAALEFIIIFRLENGASKPEKFINYQSETLTIPDVSAQSAGYSTKLSDIVLDIDYSKVIGICALINSTYRNTFLVSLLKSNGTPIVNEVPFSMIYFSGSVDFSDNFLKMEFPAKGEVITPRIEKSFSSSPSATVDVTFIFKLEK